ncbi:cilia- and flagella-associated protein 107 [Acanthochromis polyacanthus]|uniref:cilia- and flagella-associated protein 107 n=1 Tax=Acanthochromis polyacanthus TaxID=80966 RepID=UPI0022344B8C|nr:cilia- and flagella-associated protein 107 [Acanthochromis polyacanthus]
MNQKVAVQDKWAQAGWRIEQKYANKVLLGNWAEERLQFTQQPNTANSTSRVDYWPHWDFKPDISERRSALLRAEGLPSKMLFSHSDPPSLHYLLTEYEESFGHKHTNALPILQPWHPDNLTWQPERLDRPISGKATVVCHRQKAHTWEMPIKPSSCHGYKCSANLLKCIKFCMDKTRQQMAAVTWQLTFSSFTALPTNTGPLQSTNHSFEKQQPHLHSLTVYRSAYQRHPLGALCQSRFARASHSLSSYLHAANHNNKDLDLRHRSLLQVPDHCLSLFPPLQQA